jgi:energy-coupling factor transport system permease protein
LRLIVVLAAFGVFNARADLSGLLRIVPAAFRDVGLVVSIAVAFVPGVLRTVGDVRDAQRLRGERGLRRLAPTLVVPVLGMSLERALLLAESMDVRGYGRGGTSRSSRIFMWAGLALVLISVATWIAGEGMLSIGAAVSGGASIVAGFRAASIASGTSRLAGRAVAPFDIAVIVACGVAILATLAAGADGFYDPYPVIAWPRFAWTTAAVTLLFAMPALSAAPPVSREVPA